MPWAADPDNPSIRKLMLLAALDGGKPHLFEFDTGGNGFFVTYGHGPRRQHQNHLDRLPWVAVQGYCTVSSDLATICPALPSPQPYQYLNIGLLSFLPRDLALNLDAWTEANPQGELTPIPQVPAPPAPPALAGPFLACAAAGGCGVAAAGGLRSRRGGAAVCIQRSEAKNSSSSRSNFRRSRRKIS
jgi:hypothetical protein